MMWEEHFHVSRPLIPLLGFNGEEHVYRDDQGGPQAFVPQNIDALRPQHRGATSGRQSDSVLVDLN